MGIAVVIFVKAKTLTFLAQLCDALIVGTTVSARVEKLPIGTH